MAFQPPASVKNSRTKVLGDPRIFPRSVLDTPPLFLFQSPTTLPVPFPHPVGKWAGLAQVLGKYLGDHMWIKISDEEIEEKIKSKITSGKKVRWITSLMISLGISAMSGFGVLVSKSYIHTNSNAGHFSLRRFLLGFVVVFPIVYWLGRMFVKTEVNDSVNLTVCIMCERKSSGDNGATCSCGGELCSLARVKWVD